jgi:hypothetical protein
MAAAAVLVGAGWASNQFTPMLLRYRHALVLDAGSLKVMFDEDPHQIRSPKPAEYGSIRHRPGGLAKVGRGFGRADPSPRRTSSATSARLRNISASLSPSTKASRDRLEVHVGELRGLRAGRGEERVGRIPLSVVSWSVLTTIRRLMTG